MEAVTFTKEMKKDYTILIPAMADIHFDLLKNVFSLHGYNVFVLANEGEAVVSAGLKYVHNDTCYPALLVIGQIIDALQSGKHDLSKTAVMMTQTGGGCRASNYIHLLRKALAKAGFSHVPVISLNISGLEKNSGFKLTLPMLRKALATITYGDMLMLLKNQTMPYENAKGESEKLVSRWVNELTEQFSKKRGFNQKDVRENLHKIIESFKQIETTYSEKTKVGIVGEIYVKYSALANNGLEKFLAGENCEVMVPGLMGFVLYTVDATLEDIKLYGGSKIKKLVFGIAMKYLLKFETLALEALEKVKGFKPPLPFYELKALADGIIGTGNKMGEGWLLTAEMVELVRHGFENIVCAQPFGCLPNHIAGKGMIRKIKEVYENANIVPIDYDPGATKVNQENRIKLMLAVSRDRDNFGAADDSRLFDEVGFVGQVCSLNV